MDLVCTCLISFNFVMCCNSNFSFLNSFTNACLISSKFLVFPVGIVCSFVYQTNVHPINVVSNCAIFTASSWTLFAAQIVSHTNICCYGCSDPNPGMILGAKFLSWASFPLFSPKKIRYSKNNSPKFYRIKLFYLKNLQDFIKTI